MSEHEGRSYYRKADYYNSDLKGHHYSDGDWWKGHGGSGFYVDTDFTHRDLVVSLHPNMKIKRKDDGSIDYDVLRLNSKTVVRNTETVNTKEGTSKVNTAEVKKEVLEEKHVQWEAFSQEEADPDSLNVFGRAVTYPYSKVPILKTFVHEDFNVSVANSWTNNGGGDAVAEIFNMVKPYAAYLPYLKDQFMIAWDAQKNGLSKEDLKDIKNSKVADFAMTAVNTIHSALEGTGDRKNHDEGTNLFDTITKELNSSLVSQGSRFSYYQGTGTSFSHLNMRTTIFPEYDSDGNLITVLDKLEKIFPYVMGSFEHDELIKKINAEDFVAWQRPPGGFEANIFDIDAIQKGTLKLKIGSMYSLDNLVVQSMQLNLSKTVLKIPNPFKQLKTPTPLYAEITLDLMPVTKYSVNSLMDFVNGSRMKTCKINQAKGYNDALESRIDEISSLFGKGKYNSDGSINEENSKEGKYITKYETTTDIDGKIIPKLDEYGEPITTEIEVTDAEFERYKAYSDNLNSDGTVTEGVVETTRTVEWTNSESIADRVYKVNSQTAYKNGSAEISKVEFSVGTDEFLDKLQTMTIDSESFKYYLDNVDDCKESKDQDSAIRDNLELFEQLGEDVYNMPETNKDFSRIVKTEKPNGNVIYEFENADGEISDYREINPSGEIVEERKTFNSDGRTLRITTNYEDRDAEASGVSGFGYNRVISWVDGDKEVVLSNTITDNTSIQSGKYLITYYNDSLDPNKSIVKTDEFGYVLGNTEGLSVVYTDKNGKTLTGAEYDALTQLINNPSDPGGDLIRLVTNGVKSWADRKLTGEIMIQ